MRLCASVDNGWAVPVLSCRPDWRSKCRIFPIWFSKRRQLMHIHTCMRRPQLSKIPRVRSWLSETRWLAPLHVSIIFPGRARLLFVIETLTRSQQILFQRRTPIRRWDQCFLTEGRTGICLFTGNDESLCVRRLGLGETGLYLLV